jgi:hypothetical protein
MPWLGMMGEAMDREGLLTRVVARAVWGGGGVDLKIRLTRPLRVSTLAVMS